MDENLQPVQVKEGSPRKPFTRLFNSTLSWGTTGAIFGAVVGIFTPSTTVTERAKTMGKHALDWAVFGFLIKGAELLFGLDKSEHKKDVGRHLIAGASYGAAQSVADSLLQSKPLRVKTIALWSGAAAGLFGLVGLGRRLFSKNTEQTNVIDLSAIVPPQSPTIPPEQILAIAQVPKILDMLVLSKELTPEQQTSILTEVKNGRAGAVGDIAIANGYISKERVDHALLAQSQFKAEAAIADINGLSQQHGEYAVPRDVRANWGNHGINPSAATPTLADGASAAANAAQNIVLLTVANRQPDLLPIVSQGVLAAANLTRGITQGNSAKVPLAKMADTWREEMNNALLVAAQANPQAMHDAAGKPIDIHAFIAARNVEITAAVQQALQQSPGKDAGQSR